jgi:hypothetical protein
LTVAQWIRHHIDHLTGVEQYTIDKYEAYLKNDITPAFGDKPLARLTEEDISVWVTTMETTGGRDGKGHAPKTLRNKYGFLSGHSMPPCPMSNSQPSTKRSQSAGN